MDINFKKISPKIKNNNFKILYIQGDIIWYFFINTEYFYENTDLNKNNLLFFKYYWIFFIIAGNF